jgi:hypothetical protein
MGVFAKGCIGFAALVVALLAPSLAPAATAFVQDESGYYYAAPGEANDVTVRSSSGGGVSNEARLFFTMPESAGKN